MIRFFFRLLSLLCLAVACIMAVLDVSRSIAGSEIVLTALGASWASASFDTLNLAQATIQRYVSPWLWDPVMLWVLSQPGFAVFGVLALLFYMIGYRRRRSGHLLQPGQ